MNELTTLFVDYLHVGDLLADPHFAAHVSHLCGLQFENKGSAVDSCFRDRSEFQGATAGLTNTSHCCMIKRVS